MFRFSVLLAFLFACLFGQPKATPLKKKSLRRRVRAPTPTMTNGLAALDASHIVSRHAVGYHGYTSSSSDDGHHHGQRYHHRTHRRKGKRRVKYTRIKDCWCKCHHSGGFTTDTSYDYDLSSESHPGTEASESDTSGPPPMNRPPTTRPPNRTPLPTAAPPPSPAPSRAPKAPPVVTTDEEFTDTSVATDSTVPPPPVSTDAYSSSDSDYGYRSGCN